MSRRKFSPLERKLKDLEIRSSSKEPQFLKNLNSFLKTQKDTLETLSINTGLDVEVMKTILSMSRLKHCHLQELDRSNPLKHDASFPQNISLTTDV